MHQGTAPDATEPSAHGLGQRTLLGGVENDIGRFHEAIDQFLLQPPLPSRIGPALTTGELRRSTKTNDPWDIRGPGAQSAFLAAAKVERGEPHSPPALAHIQGADPLWPVHLVARHREGRDVGSLHISLKVA